MKAINKFLSTFQTTRAWIIQWINKHSITSIIAVLMIIQFVLQLYIGCEMAVTPSGDRDIIFNQAVQMAQKGEFKTNDTYNFYFLRYPNNQALLLLEAGWFMLMKICGIKNFLIGNMFLNILAIDIAIILCIMTVYRKYGKNTAILIQIMSLLFIPFYTYVPFVYTDTLTLPFTAGILLCYECLEKSRQKKTWLFYLLLCTLAVLTWLGFSLKPTVAIITIACAIHMTLQKKEFLSSCLVLLLFALLVSAGNMTVTKMNLVDQTNYDTENFPYSHWVMMGLQGNGNYKRSDREYTSSFRTRKEKQQANITMIKKRLKNYGVTGLLKHQIIKLAYTCSNGKYDMDYHLQRRPKKKSWMQMIFFKDGKLYPYYSGYCTLYQGFLLITIFAAILAGFKKQETGSEVMWKIALFGLFLFLSIWETKPRYLMHFIPIIFMITADVIYKRGQSLPRKI